MKTTFYIEGKPIGKERPRVVTRNGFSHSYTPLKTKNYEALVQWAYKTQCKNIYFGKQNIKAALEVYFPIPKSYPIKKKLALQGQPYPHKPDADNLAKSVLDALNGVAYDDDSQVVDIKVNKYYTDGSDPLFNGMVLVSLSDEFV